MLFKKNNLCQSISCTQTFITLLCNKLFIHWGWCDQTKMTIKVKSKEIFPKSNYLSMKQGFGHSRRVRCHIEKRKLVK
ncbi:hypothetical protein GYH30_051634 [Glycine max]|uniref:Uncharacterized protein n=1 Tax=Glycine max TaxID=3847 RepID=A0A0R0EGE1_SOYBN|nr:hypothetical protein GYH30_051634 [Glycine max]